MADPWWRWQGGEDYTIGLEEEVMLIDPERDWGLAPRMDDVLASLPEGLEDHVSAETQDSVLELATDPHDGAQGAADQSRELRGLLIDELAPMGLRAASAGTHPCAQWTETRISSGDRHQEVYGTMRELARREPTFGLHVHVGVRDPERAITLYNRMRAHLPLLLALSANSPFWQGRDTGLASVRTPIFQAFPRVGLPHAFDDYDDWVQAVDRLLRCGAFPEPTYLWWDIRPQPRFGTIEIRIMDAQSDPDATAGLAALTQSLAALELEEGLDATPFAGEMEILAENRFIACRDGMDAELLDLVRETRVPARTMLADVIDAARPHAQELGCAAALESAAELALVPGAQRQRRARADSEELSGVVAGLVERFSP